MPLLKPAVGAVVITDDLDEGIACFRIATDSATYFYDKAGAGFTSILDRDGIDWINFHPAGTPGVAASTRARRIASRSAFEKVTPCSRSGRCSRIQGW